VTCGSCAARIEKKLNRLDGAAATVNFPSPTACELFRFQAADSAAN
jgi:copper chaperone CopZ